MLRRLSAQNYVSYYVATYLSTIIQKKFFHSQINIMKKQAAGGGYKNESFFNNFFHCGRFHMSRHILLLNPTLIFKGPVFPHCIQNYPNYSKAFFSHAFNPGQRVKSIFAPLCSYSQHPTSVIRYELSNKMFPLQFNDEHSKLFYFQNRVETLQFSHMAFH